MKRSYTKLLSLLLGMALLLLPLSGWIPANAGDGLIQFSLTGTQNFAMAAQLVELLNEERAAAGLQPLTADPVLMDYAMQRAAEGYLYFSHTRPDGSPWTTVLGEAYSAGKSGEEGALGATNAAAVLEGWRANNKLENVYDEEINSVGIGCFYQENGRIAWVVLYHANVSQAAETRAGIRSDVEVQISALGSNLVGRVDHYQFVSSSYCDIYLYEDTTVSTGFYLINPKSSVRYPIYINSDNYSYISSDTSVLTADNVNHTLIAVAPGKADLRLQLEGVDIGILADYNGIGFSASVEVLEMASLSYEIDDAGRINVDYSGFGLTEQFGMNFNMVLSYWSNHTGYWTYAGWESDCILTVWDTDPTDTYLFVIRYWDEYQECYVEVGERLLIQLGDEPLDIRYDPEPEPELTPDPGLEIPAWDAEPTLRQVDERITLLKAGYPDGTWWDRDSHTWLGGGLEFPRLYADGSARDRMAYCTAMSDLIFGDLPARMLTSPTLEQLRIGDIITVFGKGEYIVTNLTQDYVILGTVENGWISYGLWLPESLEGQIIAALTRYESDSPGLEAQTPAVIPEGAVIVAEGTDQWISTGNPGSSYFTYWTLDDQGTLYITGYGAMNNTTMRLPWQDYADQVTRLVIGPDVTEIGRECFMSFKNLQEVVLGPDITVIHGSAFYNCTALKTVQLPAGLQEIGEYAFAYTALEAVVLPNTVTTLGNQAFANNSQLKSVGLSSGITEMGEFVFNKCTALTEVTLPEGLSVLGRYAFQSCTALETVTIPGSLLEIPAYCFRYCENLETVYIGIGTETIGSEAFYMCSALKTVHLPYTLTLLGDWAFDNCGMVEDLYYYGTQAQWDALPAGEGNYNLWMFATLHLIDPNQCHHSNTEPIPAVEPTCTAPGLTEGSVCADCGEVVVQQEEIPTVDHEYEVEGTVEPNCVVEGSIVYTCRHCGYSYEEVLPLTEHSYVDGICEYCGAGEYIVGDVSGDGNVNARDIRALLNILASGEEADPAVADFNSDGLVNARDIRALLNYLAS